MVGIIKESTVALVNSWKHTIETKSGMANITIDEDMRSFSADVISRACFGSNYTNGEKIFIKLRQLQEIMSKTSLSGIPGMRYVPTNNNRKAWRLEKEIHNLILQVVKERLKQCRQEKDLLQMVVEGAMNSDFNQEQSDQFIVDNCKNIYLAGFETTAVSATWCLMLLASDRKWQDLVRREVVELCSGQAPDYDMLLKMKKVIKNIFPF